MSLTRPAAGIEFTRDDNGYWTGRVEPWGSIDYVLANIPANGSTFSSVFGTGDPWAATTLRSATFTESPNAARGILRLHYSDAPASGGGNARPERDQPDNDPVFSIRDSDLSKPVTEHPDYKVRWDHHLLTVEGETVWTGWLVAETPEVSDSAYRETNRVIRYDEGWDRYDSEGRQWYISEAALYPGTDSWIVSGPLVEERRWFSSYDSAVTFLSGKRRGTKATPGKTFGVTGGEWLIMNSGLDADGVRWAASVSYQWADEWLAVLYGA